MHANHPTRRPCATTSPAASTAHPAAARTGLLLLLLPACFGTGWLTAPAHDHDHAPASPGPVAVATGLRGLTQPARAKPNYLPANFVPGKYDQELLRFDDAKFADFVQHGLRDEVFESCHTKLPTANDETCQKVYEATARVSPKFVDTRRRLLRGEIDSATFQALWHQHFLERQIALEQFMTWDDQLSLDGVPPGNDMFLTLSRWGIDQPEGFKLGLEGPQELAVTTQPEVK